MCYSLIMSLTPSTMTPLGTKAPEFNLPSTENNDVSLADFKNKKVMVVLFICNHCPFVIHVKDGLKSFGKDYVDKDVGIVAINSNDPAYDPSDGFEYMKKETYPFPYLFDETQEVAKAYNAACTPDMFVFDEIRSLVYRGQFDDSRPGNGKEVTGSDLRAAVDALLEEKEVNSDQKPSTGCNIKWK